MSLNERSLAHAAITDYKRAKSECEYRNKNHEECKMLMDIGRSECQYCPMEWVATIEDVLKN